MHRKCLVTLVILVGLLAPAISASANESKLEPPSAGKIKPRATQAMRWTPDTLLISPAVDASSDDVSEALQQVNGTVVRTIGSGALTVYVVEVPKGQLTKAETKLRKDKHFSDVSRDFYFSIDAAAMTGSVNDPYFPSQWHLGAINAVRAWDVSQASKPIAVLDTGTNGSVQDLSGKTYAGFDAVNNREGQSDVQGHGTMVATTAAARTNNGVATAAPARNAYIYPVRVGSSSGGISMQAVLNGIYKCGESGLKIINISANGNPPYTFAHPSMTALHKYMKWFHDTKGGLIFNSAGNNGQVDQNPLVPYLIVVSAIDTSYSLANFSTYGSPVWFTAPGTQIYCTSRDGRVAGVSGTSFSCPLVASVAAMVWGANPSLTNRQVEAILRDTCYKAGTASWTQWYGYGMPNAEAAVRRAVGK